MPYLYQREKIFVIFCQHSNLRFLKSESFTEENQDIEWKIVTDRHTHFSVNSLLIINTKELNHFIISGEK